MRTMGQVGDAYDAKREKILAKIRAGTVSASMSGIEYYPKPWRDLDLDDAGDLDILSVTLGWDGQKSVLELRRR